MDANAITFFNTIITVILTVIATHFYDDWKQKNQLKAQKENVAIIFYDEIKDIEQMIKSLIDTYKKYNIIDKNGILTYGHFGSLEQMIEVAKLDLNEYSSIYDEKGSYFQYQKEINFFDNNIVESILQFYHNLLEADKEFKLYMKFLSNYDDQNLWNSVKIEYKFVNHLLKANEEVPKLLEYFGKYKQNS